MPDVLTKAQRSKNMRHKKSKDTEIERILRKALWDRGIRYRKNYADVTGKPDIAITKYKIAVFCDSEFFHGKDWEQQKQRIAKGEHGDFWVQKISRNIERDNDVDRKLSAEGWKVIRFWGKDIEKNTEECVKVIEEAIFDALILNEENGL